MPAEADSNLARRTFERFLIRGYMKYKAIKNIIIVLLVSVLCVQTVPAEALSDVVESSSSEQPQTEQFMSGQSDKTDVIDRILSDWDELPDSGTEEVQSDISETSDDTEPQDVLEEALSLFADDEEEYAEGRLLVCVKEDTDTDSLNDEIASVQGVTGVEKIDGMNIFIVDVKNSRIEDVISELAFNSAVESIEPDYVMESEEIFEPTASPEIAPQLFGSAVSGLNDQFASRQYYLDKINVAGIWKYLKNNNISRKTKLAIIDSGCDPGVSDLKNTIDWDNSVSVLHYALSGSYARLQDLSIPDPAGHGTAVAGVCVAQAGDSNGIAGVGSAYSNNIINAFVVGICGDDGETITVSSEIKALAYAVQQGADVINMSWGNTQSSNSLYSAVRSAYDAGAIMFAAAGNQKYYSYQYNSYINYPSYPAAYDEVISVAASDKNNLSLCYTDNYIYNDQIFITAPGKDIIAGNANGYGLWTGTSLSSPIAASAAAMLHSVKPGLTTAKMKKILKLSATDIKNLSDGTVKGYDQYTGWGLLNAGLSVHYALRYGKTKYTDVKNVNSAFYKPVYWATDKKIISAYSKSKFGLNKNITRAQFAVMLWKMAGSPAVKGSISFKDCKSYKKNSDTYKAIRWITKKKILTAYPSGKFKPGTYVTRKAAVIALWRYAGKPRLTGTLSYNDCAKLKKSSLAYKAVLWATETGIAAGFTSGTYKGKFGLKVNLTRKFLVSWLYNHAQNS